MVDGPQQVAADTKEIRNESVDREKTLRVRGGFEPSHLSLALPRGLMGDLRSIVFVLPGAVACSKRFETHPRSKCVLETGKQNQIRIQAHLHGHTLVGEKKVRLRA
jgi:23S rRNA-/tRNA-specific pseudouridylate synthase